MKYNVAHRPGKGRQSLSSGKNQDSECSCHSDSLPLHQAVFVDLDFFNVRHIPLRTALAFSGKLDCVGCPSNDQVVESNNRFLRSTCRRVQDVRIKVEGHNVNFGNRDILGKIIVNFLHTGLGVFVECFAISIDRSDARQSRDGSQSLMYLPEVVRVIAEARGQTEAHVARITTENALRFFALPD